MKDTIRAKIPAMKSCGTSFQVYYYTQQKHGRSPWMSDLLAMKVQGCERMPESLNVRKTNESSCSYGKEPLHPVMYRKNRITYDGEILVFKACTIFKHYFQYS